MTTLFPTVLRFPSHSICRFRLLCGVRMITISPRLFLRFGGCNAAACAKLARQVVRQSGSVVTISDKMGTDYARFFDVPVETVRISSDPNPYALPATQRTGIVYAGNLGLNRIAPLVELGTARSGKPLCLVFLPLMCIPASSVPPFSDRLRKKTVCTIAEEFPHRRWNGFLDAVSFWCLQSHSMISPCGV